MNKNVGRLPKYISKKIVKCLTLAERNRKETRPQDSTLVAVFKLMLDGQAVKILTEAEAATAKRQPRADRPKSLDVVRFILGDQFPLSSLRRYAAAIQHGIDEKLSTSEFRKELRRIGVVAMAQRYDAAKQVRRSRYRARENSELVAAKTFIRDAKRREIISDAWGCSDERWVLLIGKKDSKKRIRIYMATDDLDLVDTTLVALYRRRAPLRKRSHKN